MPKYYLAVAILSFIIGTTVILGFKESGSPFAQRAISMDSTRVSNMNSIKYSIENYYQTNKKLPEKLEDLNFVNIPLDPESKKSYDYKTVSTTSYQLCTTFSTDSTARAQNQGRDLIYPYEDTSHKKGYDCITYRLSNYLLTTPPTPGVQSDWRTHKSTFVATF